MTCVCGGTGRDGCPPVGDHEPTVWVQLRQASSALQAELRQAMTDAGHADRIGMVFSLLFAGDETDIEMGWQIVARCGVGQREGVRFYRGMWERAVTAVQPDLAGSLVTLPASMLTPVQPALPRQTVIVSGDVTTTTTRFGVRDFARAIREALVK